MFPFGRHLLIETALTGLDTYSQKYRNDLALKLVTN